MLIKHDVGLCLHTALLGSVISCKVLPYLSFKKDKFMDSFFCFLV
jgi:hypothetical protein